MSTAKNATTNSAYGQRNASKASRSPERWHQTLILDHPDTSHTELMAFYPDNLIDQIASIYGNEALYAYYGYAKGE